ncbi:MAG TPA: D-glucuronyl C5-epimerase family protein [Candidatus Aquicultor sp.]|jgi:hypothetical protein
MLWAYFYYPGSLASVTQHFDTPTLPNFATQTEPSTDVTSPKVAPTKPLQNRLREKQPKQPAESVKSAQALVRQLMSEGRKKEASEVIFSLDLLSQLNTNTATGRTRARAIMRDLEKTTAYYAAGNTASGKAQILGQYEGGHLAYVYYPNYGVHFNPVTTCNIALEKYAQGDNKQVVAIADAILDNAIVKEYKGVGKYYIWEYYFDLEFNKYKFDAPWASGMAQGLILDVLGKTYTITDDKKYLRAAELVLNSFKVPYTEGGVTDIDNHGNWYLEVAATNKLRILNGYLFTLYSMHNFYEATGNTKVLKLFNAGVGEAQYHLEQYDLGYWSNYSLLQGDRASYGYHKIHVDLLKKLYAITKVPAFRTYADKFAFYQKYRFFDIPPTHRSFKAISVLTERGIVLGKDGWFGAGANTSRAELITWIARGRGWAPLATYQGYYRDINKERADWGYIEAAYEHGLKMGNPDGYFRPNDPVNRADMASILCKAFDVSSAKSIQPSTPVSDIATGVRDKNSIVLALSSGLMEPYEPNYFRPTLGVTREQAVNMLYKLFVPLAKQ